MTAVCSPISVMTSYFDLIDIMILDRLDRLSQRPCSSMLVIWMLIPVLMKDDATAIIRIFSTVQIPVVTCVSGLYRHIIRIRHYYRKIPCVDCLKFFSSKHIHHLAPGSATI